MAEDDLDLEGIGEPKSKLKLILIVVAALAVIGGGGYYAYDSGLLEGGSDELPEPPSLPGN